MSIHGIPQFTLPGSRVSTGAFKYCDWKHHEAEPEGGVQLSQIRWVCRDCFKTMISSKVKDKSKLAALTN